MAATELATAYLSLVPSMGGAQGKIAQELAGVDAGGIGRGMGSKMGGGLAGSFKAIAGPAIALVAGSAIKDFATNAVASFSELEDSTAAAGVVFGSSMDQIIAQSKTAGSTMGLSSQQVINAANTYGTYGKAAGLAGDDLAKFATDQTKLAADMASFKGTSPEQAIEAIGAALRGETEPIRAYGVMLDDASMKQKALEMGLISTTKDALEPQNKILAAQALIMEQTTDAQGDFARTSTSTANVQKTLAAESENLNAKLGKSLAPAFTAVRLAALAGVRGMSGALDTIGPKVEAVSAKVIAGFGLIKEVFVTGDLTAGTLKALGLSEDAPIIDKLFDIRDGVRGGLALIREVFVTGDLTGPTLKALNLSEDAPIIDKLFDIRDGIQVAMGGIRDFFTGFTIPSGILSGAFADAGTSMSPMMEAGAAVREVFAGMWAAIQPLIPSFVQLWSSVSPLSLVFQVLQPFLPSLLAMFGQLASVIGGTLVGAITGILPSILQLSQLAVQLFQGVLAAVLPVVVQLITQLGTTMATLMPIIMGVVSVVMALAVQLLSALMPIILQLVSAVLPMVVTIFGAVLSAIGPVIQMVAGLLIPIIQALMPVVVTVFSVVANVIRSAMTIVMGIIQVVTGIITGNWQQVFTGLGNIVSGAFQLIVGLVKGGLDIAWSLIQAGLGLIKGFFESVFNGVTSFLGGVWRNITDGVSSMIGDVIGFFSGLIGRITGAIGNAGRALWDTGVNIIQGLIDGIGSMMGAIGRAVLNIVPEAIRGPFEDLLGIRSPSRVAIYWGHMIGGGLVGGIQDMYQDVEGAAVGLALAMTPDVPEFVGAARTAGAASVAYPAVGGATTGEPAVVQNVYPSEKMSETNLAEIAARKIVGVLV